MGLFEAKGQIDRGMKDLLIRWNMARSRRILARSCCFSIASKTACISSVIKYMDSSSILRPRLALSCAVYMRLRNWSRKRPLFSHVFRNSVQKCLSNAQLARRRAESYPYVFGKRI